MALIATKSLTRTFGGRVTALNDLTGTVPPGIVGLVGANGATDLLAGRVSVPVAVVMSVAVTAGAIALTVDRLRSFSLAGETFYLARVRAGPRPARSRR